MTRVTVGKWGKNLAVRVPLEIARASGLSDGEQVEVEIHDGDILIRRQEGRTRLRSEAEAAAAEIIEDSKRFTLGGVSIFELLHDGRR